MKKVKYLFIILVILGGLFFLFGLEIVPENFQPQEVLEIAKDRDVIIIFNSGGWGDTPLEKADDFAPIIEEIERNLKEWDYNPLVISYIRTKDNLLGRITGARDFLNSFYYSSQVLAGEIEFLAEKLPDKKIIITGLSNGGTFVSETYERISEEFKDSVYVITAGVPFWHQSLESENVLQLNNNGRDSLSVGRIKTLISSLVKAPFKWVLAKINGENLTFSRAIQMPGHEYFWSSPEVGPQILTFIKNKIH